MDLNFLVFPRPDFECSDEMFYTKLLFVPKRKRSINDVTFVVRGLKSVMNKTDLSPKRKKDNEINRVEIQESQEKKSYLLNTPSKKKLIFGEMSGVSKLRAQETFEEKKNGKANLDSTFEKNQDEIRRVIPVMEKFVRFPQRQKKSNLICGDIDSKKEIYGPVNVPASMCIQLKKHLKFQSSKQTIWLEKNKVENNRNVGNKQLKESYSTNVFPVFVSKSNTMVNKNIHNENSNIIKKLNLKKNINVIEKYEIDFDCGDFPAPDERNQTADNEKDNHSQNLKNLLQKKSLNDLNNRFSVSPARQTIKELTDKDCSSLPQSSSKGSSFYKPIPVPTPKKPQFTSSPLDEDEDIDSLKEMPRHCISPDSKLSQYQRGKINLKTSIENSFVPSEAKSGIASHLLVRQSIERNASKNKNHLGASIHETESIPCLLIKPYFSSDFVILYFHANGEDIQQIQCLCDTMKNNLNCWVVACEYPGYSVYKSDKISEKDIIFDSECVLNYLEQKCQVPLDRIFVMGRSLGSGPASYLASKNKVAGLVLISAFTSINDVAVEHYGIFGNLIKDRFNNLDSIKKVKSPTLIIHGTEDKFVPFNHAKKLCESCKEYCLMISPAGMTHDITNFKTQIENPFFEFLREIKFLINPCNSIHIS